MKVNHMNYFALDMMSLIIKNRCKNYITFEVATKNFLLYIINSHDNLLSFPGNYILLN